MNDYPEVVKRIHNEFNIAGERLLQESLSIIENAEKIDINKAIRLNNVGFVNNPLLSKAKQIEELTNYPAKIAKLVIDYKQTYPLHKFISHLDVEKICKKYNLILGGTDDYIGFVPEKNIKEIEFFNTNYNSIKKRFLLQDVQISGFFDNIFSTKMHMKYWAVKNFIKKNNSVIKISEKNPFLSDINKDGYWQKKAIEFELESSFSHLKKDWSININVIKFTRLSAFMICAPQKDMIKKKNHTNIEYVIEYVPDPVVLYPVELGYIIVTAWGDEASDPLVTNHQMN